MGKFFFSKSALAIDLELGTAAGRGTAPIWSQGSPAHAFITQAGRLSLCRTFLSSDDPHLASSKDWSLRYLIVRIMYPPTYIVCVANSRILGRSRNRVSGRVSTGRTL